VNDLNLSLFSFGIDAFAKLAEDIIIFEGIQNILRFRLMLDLFFLLLGRFFNEPFLFLKVFVKPTEPKAEWLLFLLLNLLYFL
jgi:hypothetical protein